MLLCGRSKCIFKVVQEMIERMKDEIVQKQNVAYPEQIVVADIYNIAASTLAEACRRSFSVDLANCVEKEKHREAVVTMDTFILLKTIADDGLIDEEYKNSLFDALIKINPNLKEQVEKDRELGIL
ncbi:MAG: hypothetical protein QMD12_01385 [Candidatus Aenigmarchaeota archaeon]|nr:hypothetical protein [Candidatus Aenigmarchaeota archaeon]